jgi:hypothetical protein
VDADFGFPIGDLMRLSLGAEFDIDRSELTESYIQLTRELDCWIGSMRFLSDKTEEDTDNFGVEFMIYLKAFPDVRLGSTPRAF